MSSGTAPSLPHRTISTIRAGGQSTTHGLPTTPHTPTRTVVPSAFGSPSTLRADDEVIVIELGSRRLRLGFAGDPAPKRIVSFCPEQQRRAGDFRDWDVGYQNEWRKRAAGKPWGSDHELWQLDVRGQDLALVGDKLERELRDAFTKYLLIDSRPRRVTLVLPPTIPIPLISSVLDTLFNRFQAPSVSLLSSPVMAAMAAGMRAALVIDLGWHETTVTAVYEFREVQTWRTIRAGKLLVEETYEFLTNAIDGRPTAGRGERTEDKLDSSALSFEECEDFATRMLWCKRTSREPIQQPVEGLPTLHEQDESETTAPPEDGSLTKITLTSCIPPKTVEIPFAELAEPCEAVFFETRLSPSCFDDHEIPVHLLAYRALLQLPLDVRAVCMSRIIFTGGCSNIIGLRGRIFDEVSLLAKERGWDPVRGKGADQYKANPKLRRNSSRQSSEGPVPVPAAPDVPATVPAENSSSSNAEGGEAAAAVNPAHAPPEADHVEELIKKDKNYKPLVQGALRVLDSLGPWCGASLAAQLKIPALATVDRELWLHQGVHGACRPSEVDVKAQQRQSVGGGSLIRGQGSQAIVNWTLGVWGTL
ncbi:actin-like ATPase domain-containing protein [Durotheca rogersii]|uniref:actin-like ATPase domain-containing protein n=1 Tax=Durotheca rogersii TaxID=419775 RepID=UPI0022210AF5|nr:actin-like ATPase domain-containing protein [Durotheca rogersii]KAI5862259.1 actin-like ATPase domain-containing protein [Durotheca rogersii]